MGGMSPSLWGILWKLDVVGSRQPGEGSDAHSGLLKACAISAGGLGMVVGGAEGARGSGMLKVLGWPSREGCRTCWWCLWGVGCHRRWGCPGCGEGLLLRGQWAQVG